MIAAVLAAALTVVYFLVSLFDRSVGEKFAVLYASALLVIVIAQRFERRHRA